MPLEPLTPSPPHCSRLGPARARALMTLPAVQWDLRPGAACYSWPSNRRASMWGQAGPAACLSFSLAHGTVVLSPEWGARCVAKLVVLGWRRGWQETWGGVGRAWPWLVSAGRRDRSGWGPWRWLPAAVNRLGPFLFVLTGPQGQPPAPDGWLLCWRLPPPCSWQGLRVRPGGIGGSCAGPQRACCSCPASLPHAPSSGVEQLRSSSRGSTAGYVLLSCLRGAWAAGAALLAQSVPGGAGVRWGVWPILVPEEAVAGGGPAVGAAGRA